MSLRRSRLRLILYSVLQALWDGHSDFLLNPQLAQVLGAFIRVMLVHDLMHHISLHVATN
jgi:hypothetical protein